MSRVEEIEAAVEGLTPEEYQRFEQWFNQRRNALWDQSLDQDSASGKLDFLFDEAKEEAPLCFP